MAQEDYGLVVVTCKPNRNGRTSALSFQQRLEAVLVLGNTHQVMAMVKLKVPHNMTLFQKKKKKKTGKKRAIHCEIRNLITSQTIN